MAVPFHLPVAERVASLAAGMFHVLALTSHGRVFAWGKGDYGQLGLGRPGNWDAPKEVAPLSDKAVVFVAAGGWHSCALAADGACFTWGRGEYGRLGMAEDQADKQRPTEVAFEPDANEETKEKEKKKIVDAALGGSHTCFLDARGAVWSVGRNNHGRLGRVVHGKWTGAPGRVVFPAQGGRRVGLRINRRGGEAHARRGASRVIKITESNLSHRPKNETTRALRPALVS